MSLSEAGVRAEPSASESAAAGPGVGRERAVLATVALATMLAPLNSTMIAVALPSVIAEMDVSVATASWLVTAYLIAMAALQPVAGKLGDRLGRRRLILGGLVYFGLASLGASAATSFPLLVFFRVQQAIAGAIALPNAGALVREVVPAERRAASFGLVGAAVALAAAAGPPLGGLLAGAAGWRAIFYANVPIVLAALAIGWLVLPTARPRGAKHPFDLPGAVLLSALLVGAAALLTGRRDHGLDWLMLAGALALLVGGGLFLRRELRHPDPLVRPQLFRRRVFAAANAAVALSNLAMYVTLLALPLLLTLGGQSSAAVGGLLAAMSLAMVVCAPIGGRLADRLGRRRTTVAGLSLLTLGLLPLALFPDGLAPPALAGTLALTGLGLGLSSAPIQTSAIEAVDPGESGVASGVFSTSRYFGSILGSILLASLVGDGHDPAAFEAVFLVVVVAAALSVVAALGLRDAPSGRA